MASINGFSVGSARDIGVRSFVVPGTSVSLPVRAEVAPLLIGFAKEFNESVERLVPGWNWGYAYRAVRGGTSYSFHSAGIAIDLNAPRHPLGVRGTFSSAQAARIRVLADKYGLRWGGMYISRADEMHLEVILSRADALERVRKLQAPAASPVRPSTGIKLGHGQVISLQQAVHVTADGWWGDETDVALNGVLKNKGPVTSRQVWVGTKVDGVWGANSEASRIYTIKKIQRALNVAQDGIFGPNTERAFVGARNKYYNKF